MLGGNFLGRSMLKRSSHGLRFGNKEAQDKTKIGKDKRIKDP
jgi:hypothetical protein